MGRRRLGFWQWFAVGLVKPVMTVWTRRTWRGMEHLRHDGGVIIVPNHISHADPLVSAHFIYDAGRWPRFLGKVSVFRVPVIGWLLHRCRQIPVERGTAHAGRSLEALVAALDEGGAVVIYPEGTTTRHPDLWPMRGKTGAARLALATGAPVVPMAMWGPQRLFDPRTKRFDPRPRIPVTVLAGPPVDLGRWQGASPDHRTLEEMTDEIMLRLRDLLAEIRGGTAPPLFPRPAGGPAGEPGAAA
ncbi:lysophospholipid acyltransferase family protein [Micromonospora yangpuensis]|uniref:1-acyl-sn-glycerol-3-phosphate acyltransferases n=1 Tax=Micromonospora yangpuensis TaxID=683228 RepID=A0A1C6UBK1_9ACTN|nr:lysophospholipid acyltransferase family protein [Micromonospora yangpuensis]GGL87016.1 1-acyl-sn-glycerol-3-phosphate acyltransferase [Micromonospora yangpuensis]SCL51273.1 1-acyl-sn-glycerol-3-phosphate acyltransferases [Micromonospora yangpuensis]